MEAIIISLILVIATQIGALARTCVGWYFSGEKFSWIKFGATFTVALFVVAFPSGLVMLGSQAQLDMIAMIGMTYTALIAGFGSDLVLSAWMKSAQTPAEKK
jgi:hypothetical protein